MTHQNLTSGLRWMRDKFAAWLASVTVFTFLWIAVGIAVAVLFVWDGVWSRHQAPSNLDPLTFQGAGWVMRLWTVFALAGAVWCFRHGARWVGAIMAFTWVLTSLMTYGHALGFIASGQTERYATGNAVEQTIVAQTESNADKVAKLEAMKAEVRLDLATRVAPLNAEITRLDTDGKINEDLATTQKERRAALEDAAQVKLDALDAQILALQDTDKTELVAGETAKAEVVKFDPLYVLLAEWTDGKEGTPDDADARNIAQRVGAFWAFLLEMIGGAGPALLYSIHAHMASRKPQTHEEYSDEVPAGTVRVEMPEEEWAAYQEAMQHKQNQKQGIKKSKTQRRQGNKIEQSKQYAEERVSEFMLLKNAGLSTAQIAAKFGLTAATMDLQYGNYMTTEEHAALFGPGFKAEPEQEPPVAVADSPQDETETAAAGPSTVGDDTPLEENDISNEDPENLPEPAAEGPKDYGVALYDPANEEKPDEEAA